MKIGLIFSERPSRGWVPDGVDRPGDGHIDILKPKGYAKPDTKIGLFAWNTGHNLTHRKKDQRKPTIGLFKPDLSNNHEEQLQRGKIRLVGWVERTKDRAIEASGDRFTVSDRDGHPRGAFPTLPPAQARADEVGGFVFDRIEGRNVYSAQGEEQYDIPEVDVPDEEVDQ